MRLWIIIGICLPLLVEGKSTEKATSQNTWDDDSNEESFTFKDPKPMTVQSSSVDNTLNETSEEGSKGTNILSSSTADPLWEFVLRKLIEDSTSDDGSKNTSEEPTKLVKVPLEYMTAPPPAITPTPSWEDDVIDESGSSTANPTTTSSDSGESDESTTISSYRYSPSYLLGQEGRKDNQDTAPVQQYAQQYQEYLSYLKGDSTQEENKTKSTDDDDSGEGTPMPGDNLISDASTINHSNTPDTQTSVEDEPPVENLSPSNQNGGSGSTDGANDNVSPSPTTEPPVYFVYLKPKYQQPHESPIESDSTNDDIPDSSPTSKYYSPSVWHLYPRMPSTPGLRYPSYISQDYNDDTTYSPRPFRPSYPSPYSTFRPSYYNFNNRYSEQPYYNNNPYQYQNPWPRQYYTNPYFSTSSSMYPSSSGLGFGGPYSRSPFWTRPYYNYMYPTPSNVYRFPAGPYNSYSSYSPVVSPYPSTFGYPSTYYNMPPMPMAMP